MCIFNAFDYGIICYFLHSFFPPFAVDTPKEFRGHIFALKYSGSVLKHCEARSTPFLRPTFDRYGTCLPHDGLKAIGKGKTGAR